MPAKQDRLDGWKAIAGFFGRERTTVIRWARERAMPIHALPGGKTRTVYAFASELEAWANSREQAKLLASAPVEEVRALFPSRAQDIIERPSRHRWVWSGAGTAVTVMALVVIATPQNRKASASPPMTKLALPSDPKTAALFLQARDDWAQRKARSLNRSIRELQKVTALAPDFAPAHADLADAYILESEDGAVPVDIAFDKAARSAERALSLDPSLAAAHRALGFVQYWWKHDPTAAGSEFRAAVKLDPADAQTHFWYANVLADAGEGVQAAREFNLARYAIPGSDQIGADYAWALWSFGRGEEALTRLRAVLAEHPDNAEAQDCFGSIVLADGDYEAYLQTQRTRVTLRRDPALATKLRALDAGFARNGGPGLLKVAISQEIAAQESAQYPDHSEAAFYASLMGDRSEFLRIAGIAQYKHERWGAAGYVRRMRARWKSDAAVKTVLDRLSAAPVETDSAT